MVYFPNELAPWERRSEYYHTVNLGNNVERQNELISAGFNRMLEVQFSCANAIVSSQEITQELLSEGFSGVIQGINNISEGIDGLKSAFEFGISEVVWQIEQNREVLKSILGVLSAPLDTQAKELRKRAEEAYSNGWIDDALEDFLASEIKNKYDFTIHISLGMIYLFHIVDKKKSLEYFEKAIKYSRPKSNYHTSFALLHKALIHRSFGDLKEAEKCASEASTLTPEFAEAIYQTALYRALAEYDIYILEKAIEIDPKYLLKANGENDFYNKREQLEEIALKFREKEKENYNSIKYKINKLISNFYERIINANEILKKNSLKKYFDKKDAEIMFNRIKDKFYEVEKRNSFFDYYKFNNEYNSIIEGLNEEISNLKVFIAESIELVSKDISKIQREKSKIQEERSYNITNRFDYSKSLISVAVGVIIAFMIGVYKWYNQLMYGEYNSYIGFKGTYWDGNSGTNIFLLSLAVSAMFLIYDFVNSKKNNKVSDEEKSIDLVIEKLNKAIAELQKV